MAMTIVLILLSLVLLSAGGLLWHTSRAGEQRAAAKAFIGTRLAANEAAAGPVSGETKAKYSSTQKKATVLDQVLLRAGIVPTTGFYVRNAGFIVLVTLLAGLAGQWLGAAIGFTSASVAVYFRLWWKAGKRQARMVSQLPVFLDAVVRLITIGNSLGSAFQAASASVDMPLREVMERVASQNRSGKELDHALAQTARLYGLKELQLVSAVVAVALKFGGRSDQVLDRMASFIRDLEQARQELHALSAEVKLSAWILALLPLGIAAFIVTFNNTLFVGMWNDPVGFKMVIGAMVLQTVGCYWLYRMAKSV